MYVLEQNNISSTKVSIFPLSLVLDSDRRTKPISSPPIRISWRVVEQGEARMASDKSVSVMTRFHMNTEVNPGVQWRVRSV